ncbi:hypothetical protein Bcep1808_5496 [Burkholderia vietnamiensis G4]|uniref:Uncharacterized protein n=1 Tax=Burkholderia vietnamiensis (strain G4 / LMG 22486) TaxID=269482 RepID=A4JQ87_BURVG|nr:hypothetical protein Bcep1808_5496 [Burkholderia vietnamiensis G4]
MRVATAARASPCGRDGTRKPARGMCGARNAGKRVVAPARQTCWSKHGRRDASWRRAMFRCRLAKLPAHLRRTRGSTCVAMQQGEIGVEAWRSHASR